MAAPRPIDPDRPGQPSLTRPTIVAAARGWLGTPYLHQGALRGVGCDCLGLLRGLWGELIGPAPETVPPYTPDWAETGGHEALLDFCRRRLVARQAPAPASILLFRWRDTLPAKHLGLVSALDPLRMIHAHDGAKVAEIMVGTVWQRRIAGVFDWPGLVPQGAPSGAVS